MAKLCRRKDSSKFSDIQLLYTNLIRNNMKKFLFSVALLLGGMAVASAQNLTPVGKFNERLRIIPKTFTVDKQAKAVAFTSEE